MTESPRRNSLLMKRSLFRFLFFLSAGLTTVSVHISLTFSRTMFMWRSKALTRARSLRLLRVWMRIWVWLRTAT